MQTSASVVRAYGDRQGDGMVQLSFVLPLPPSPRAREAAKRFAELHGVREPLVSTSTTVDVTPAFNRIPGPEASHTILAGSWDYTALGLKPPPNIVPMGKAAVIGTFGSGSIPGPLPLSCLAVSATIDARTGTGRG